MSLKFFSKDLDNFSSINVSPGDLFCLGDRLESIQQAGQGLEAIAKTLDFILVCHGCGVDDFTEDFTEGEILLGGLSSAAGTIGKFLSFEVERTREMCEKIIDQEAARLATRKEK